jgi:alpha-L-fucosidase
MTKDAETCMTMRHNWGYDRNDDHWKSTKDIIEFLALCGSRGVNLLLNVGPSPEGTLLPEEIQRLKDVGDWMAVNGESITGTSASPVDFDFWWGAMTQKDRSLYLHVLEWNPNGIEFHGIVGKPAKAFLLNDPSHQSLPIEHDTNTHITKINVPAEAPDARDTVIVVQYDVPIVADVKVKGNYHWYTRRNRRHTGIMNRANAGQTKLLKAVEETR